MRPVAYQDLGAASGVGRAALLSEPREVPPVLVQQIVVPARDKVGRRLDLRVLPLDSVRLPVVVVSGVFEPVPDMLDAIELADGVEQWEPAVVWVVDGKDPLCLGALLRVQAELEDHVKLHDAIVVEMPEIRLLTGPGEYAFQMWAAKRRGHVGRKRVVGKPERSDCAIAPGLLAEPLLSVIPILGLVDVR